MKQDYHFATFSCTVMSYFSSKICSFVGILSIEEMLDEMLDAFDQGFTLARVSFPKQRIQFCLIQSALTASRGPLE